MVAALFMGAAIRPRPVFVKMFDRHSGMVAPELGFIRVQTRVPE